MSVGNPGTYLVTESRPQGGGEVLTARGDGVRSDFVRHEVASKVLHEVVHSSLWYSN